MESKNAKSVKKTIKASRKAASKELEINLASRFLEVIKGLGHSTKEISREIQKTSKRISKELAKTITDVLEPAQEKKLPKKGVDVKGTPKKAPKPVAKKELVKAKKVVSRAGTGKKGELSTGILTASSQVSTPREEDLAPQAETIMPSLTVKRNKPGIPGLTVEKNNDDVVSPS